MTRESENPNYLLTTAEHREDGLELGWNDGQKSFYHYIWLRDSCYCEQCGNSYSSKRYLVPNQLDLEVSAASFEITAQGGLQIQWTPEQHESHYSGDWLRRYRYDSEAHLGRFHKPRLWDSSVGEGLPKVDFGRARDGEAERLDLYRKLRDFGFVVVTGGPAEAGGIESVATLIGEMAESAYTRIFDLSPASSINTLGNTFHAVPPHTDEAFRHNPPGVNILGCVRPASEGGESVLVDGFQVAARLRQLDADGFDLLVRHGQSFNRIHHGSLDQRSRYPMISLDDRGEICAVRIHTRAAAPMDLPVDVVKPYYAAYHQLCRLMMQNENQVRFQLDAGDSVLFDNYRVLHSRTEFSDPQRFLQICNVSREGFHEKLRLLADKLGYRDEADMILTA